MERRLTAMRTLVINAGSSSLKHAIVDADSGAVVDEGTARWEPGDGSGRHAEALREALTGVDHRAVAAVGHRVVHGGERFAGPALIDQDVRRAIEELVPLAPLHQRAALEGIDAAAAALPDVPQVASFDTAFHRTLPPAAATYAVPREWTERFALRRYGFHGLNVAWCASRARELLGEERARRLVVAHLGSGCSVTAVLDGRSVDTTMGLTPLDGVPMATRSGALDPGLLLRVAREGVSIDEMEAGLTYRAGLLGVSGVSADLREVVRAADAGQPAAALAVSIFVRGVASAIAAVSTSLAGLDCLVFTAGVGEHSPRLRSAVAERLVHLGVRLDPDANAGAGPDARIGAAAVDVLVIAAGEEPLIAREAASLLRR